MRRKCFQVLFNFIEVSGYSFAATSFMYFIFAGSVQVQRQINRGFRMTPTSLAVQHPVQLKPADVTPAHFHVLLESYPHSATHLCKEVRRRRINTFVLPPPKSHLSPYYLCFFSVAHYHFFIHLLWHRKKHIFTLFLSLIVLPLMWWVFIFIFSPSCNNPA